MYYYIYIIINHKAKNIKRKKYKKWVVVNIWVLW